MNDNSMTFDITWLKELPRKELNGFEDEVVYRVARMTLDFTIPHIPYLTGRLQKASLSFGVQGNDKVYSLGATADAPYARAVYNYSQTDTNWTNPRSYSKWFETEYYNQREVILGNSVSASYKNWK
jgi:hypothetical protein